MKSIPTISILNQSLPEFLRNPDPNLFLSDNYVVLDFETTILDKGSPYEEDNSIVCSSWKCGPDHVAGNTDPVYRKGSEFDQQELVEMVESADFWVAHNAKFEYGWLERCGLPLESTLAFCTMLAEYVLLSNRSNPQMLSLERCLKRRKFPNKTLLGKKLLAAGICPSTWADNWLEPYSIQDSVVGEKLFLDQREVLAARGQLGVAFTRMIFTAPLVDIEKNGMHLDPDRAPKLQRDYNAELTTVMSHIDRVTGGANPSSPTQMRKVIYEDLKFPLPKDSRFYGKPDKDGNPQPSTGTDLINSLVPRTQKQRTFIGLKKEYARLNAALTKCLNKFVDCINETPDHILTAAMNQAITVTQRLSSTGRNYKAQFQNFPRIFKPLFCARHEGWFIGEIDQAQLEYRVAVFLGQDEAGLQDILNGVDSHSLTVEKVWPDKFAALDPKTPEFKALRTEAKSRTFKPLYGGQSGTRDEVRYYKWFTQKHKGITSKQAEWKASAVNSGKVQIPSGLVFYFPGTKVLEDGYITNSTNICNYPVQSFATADIVPIGVTYQWHFMRVAKLQSFLVNTVHDSSIGEVHPDEQEVYTQIGEYAHVDRVYNYLKVVYDVDFNVPLEIEAEYGTHWANSEDWERKYLT